MAFSDSTRHGNEGALRIVIGPRCLCNQAGKIDGAILGGKESCEKLYQNVGYMGAKGEYSSRSKASRCLS